MPRPVRITVVGSGRCDGETASVAERVGREVARRGGVLICGGLGGVMEAAARGAREAGGTTVGILPGPDAAAANPHILIPIATGLGHARNAVNVGAADAAAPDVVRARSAEEAVATAFVLAEGKRS